MRKIIYLGLFTILFIISQFSPFYHAPQVAAEGKKLVYIVPVQQSIERGLEHFLERAFTEAEDAMADVIILEINTLGGAIDAAFGIGDLIDDEQIPVVAYIKDNAASAGAYISLNADKIYMEPGSTIGAAAVRTIGGNEADPKITSYWVKNMRSAANLHGRNPDIAEGMVVTDMVIPGVTEYGDLITLDAEEAVTHNIADGIVNNRQELLAAIDMETADQVEITLSPAEKLARFVTNPIIIPILLIIGLAGIVIELLAPGFGVPGIVGISAFGLYFFGHFIAGFAGWESILFFLAGFILMLIEVFVPGFGIFGILGILSFGTGVSLAAYQTEYGLISLGVAVIINSIIAVVLIKYYGHRGVWNKFILREEQKKEGGYVSHKNEITLLGKKGTSITKLRPAGTAIIEGKRYDVISEGGLINANLPIEVIQVEGTRIVVREIR